MEHTNSIKSETPSKAEFPDVLGKPLHERFGWLNDALRGQSMPEHLALVKDIASGVVLMLELVQKSELNRDRDILPVLSVQDSETMLFAAMRATEMLCDRNDELLDALVDQDIKSRSNVETAGAVRAANCEAIAS